MRKTTIGNERGSTFLTTMISVTLMTVVGGYIYQNSSSRAYFVNEMRKSAQAQMIAEAGLSETLGVLRNNWGAVTSTFPTKTLGPGTYQGSVTSSGGRFLIQSKGTVQGHERFATAEAKPPTISALSYAMAGGAVTPQVIDSGTGQSPGTIVGDIYTAGPLTLDGPSSGGVLAVTGNVSSQSTITTTSTATVSGAQNQNWSTSVAFPAVDFSFYQNIATANSQYFNGNKTYTSGQIPGTPAGGVIFVNGDVTIEGTQLTQAAIIATGNITIQKSGNSYPKVTINQFSNYPALMTQNGNISYISVGNGGAYLTTTGLIYAGNNFTLSSGNHDVFTITGSILARGALNTSGLTAQNNTAVSYVAQNPPGLSAPSSSMTVVSYNQ